MNGVTLWIVVGLLLVAAEILTGGFGILWFGVAAFGAAGVAALGFGGTAQVVTVSIGGLVLFALTRPLARRLQRGRHLATNARALIGQVGVVTRAIGGPEEPGYIRLNGEEWRAAAPMALGEGAKAVVRQIVGATLQVEAMGSPTTKEESRG